MTRTVMDATDIKTGKKIYFNGHAQATFMADGSTVEDNINASNEKLSTLNLVATDVVSEDGLAYVLTSDFESKMDEINGLLDEINGLFTFYINDVEFKASQDMTWEDWIESKYNTEKFESEYIETLHGVESITDLIIANQSYIILTNGVYVVGLNGEILNGETFDGAADQVTGIGLITDNGAWIVALDEWESASESTAWNGNYSAWGGNGIEVTGCFINSDESQALLDFNGESNTDAIIVQLKGTTDGNSIYTGAPAAEYCRAYSNGCKGVGEWYLPAAGELNEIAINYDAVDAILTKLGKNNLSEKFNSWSSSQYSSKFAWCYVWDDCLLDSYSKPSCHGVRPICKL